MALFNFNSNTTTTVNQMQIGFDRRQTRKHVARPCALSMQVGPISSDAGDYKAAVTRGKL